jgi:hypothetical protein
LIVEIECPEQDRQCFTDPDTMRYLQCSGCGEIWFVGAKSIRMEVIESEPIFAEIFLGHMLCDGKEIDIVSGTIVG